MDLNLTGKIALVTGSTAGIGFAIARSLAIEGAYVYVNGRTQNRVEAAMAAIRSQAGGTRVDGIAADFSGPAGAEAVIVPFEKAMDAYSRMAAGQEKAKQVLSFD